MLVTHITPQLVLMLGNIDQKGQLEDDGLLDDESKRHLGALAMLGADIDVKSLLGDEAGESTADDVDSSDVKLEKSSSAVNIKKFKHKFHYRQ